MSVSFLHGTLLRRVSEQLLQSRGFSLNTMTCSTTFCFLAGKGSIDDLPGLFTLEKPFINCVI